MAPPNPPFVHRHRVVPLAAHAAEETPEDRDARIRAIRKAVTGSEEVRVESDALKIINRYKSRVRSPLTGIRAHCIECSGGSLKDVAECPVVKCALHPFRFARNPHHAKTKARLAQQAGGDFNQENSDEEENDE